MVKSGQQFLGAESMLFQQLAKQWGGGDPSPLVTREWILPTAQGSLEVDLILVGFPNQNAFDGWHLDFNFMRTRAEYSVEMG